MIIKLIITMLIIFSSTAYARDDYSKFNSDGEDYSHFNSRKDDQYRDWNSVLNLLASKGVDTANINWDEIETSCSNIQNKTSGNEYNKCKYNHTLNYAQYQKDISYCNASAQQEYFEYLKSDNNGTMINNTVESNNTYTGNKKNRLNSKEEKKFKDSASVLCLHNLGWINSGSWIAGKNNKVIPHRNYK